MSTKYRTAVLAMVLGESGSAAASPWGGLPKTIMELSLPWSLLILGLALAALGRFRPFSRKPQQSAQSDLL